MPAQFLHGVEVVQVDDGLRPIATASSSIIGLIGTAPDAPDETFPTDRPVLIAGPRAAAELGAAGTLRDAYDALYAQGAQTVVMVRVPEAESAAETKANVIGDPSLQTGAYALLQSPNLLGLTPRILAAPGFTNGDAPDTVNPAISALLTVADKVRAVVVKDGPNRGETDAVTDRENYGSDRLYIVDPAVRVFDTEIASEVTRPASAYVAGLIARRDLERGFWWSPSNQVIRGVTGTSRPVEFHLNDPQTEANRMNEAGVSTIIRRGGFRLWGNRGAGIDPQWAFLSVRRTADVVYQSIEAAHLWAMDRPFSAQLIQDIRDSVQAFGQSLVNQGALLGFNTWLDPELNTEAALKSGKLFMNFDFEPPAPLEHLIFRAYRNGEYYNDLVSDVRQAA